MLKRYFLFVALPLLAFGLGLTVGAELGDPAARREASLRAHNAAVVAAVEAGATRYSSFPDGDANLLPDWAKTPRVPMSAMDEYYRTGDDSQVQYYLNGGH